MAHPVMRDNSQWTKSTYVYQLGEDFSTMQELVAFLLNPDLKYSVQKNYLKTFDNLVVEMTPEHYTRPNQSDTSVGGNDAINCYWQFCEYDDIIHPMTSLNGRMDAGMGRVYSETYDKHQQLLHLTMGVPHFGNLQRFYGDMIDMNVAAFVNGSSDKSAGAIVGSMLGFLVGSAVGTASSLLKVGAGLLAWKLLLPVPFLPAVYLFYKAMDWAGENMLGDETVTRYYDFRSKMPMYYRYVNSMLIHLGVNMGLIPDGEGTPDSGGATDGQFNSTYRKLHDPTLTNPDAVPDLMKYGPDIFEILAKRDRRLHPSSVANIKSDDYLISPEKEDDISGWFSGFLPRLKSSMFGADKFISFRVEKSTDSSESIGNNTGESAVAQEFNSTVAQSRDRSFRFSKGNIFDTGFLNSITDAVTSFMQSMAHQVAFSGLVDAQMIGSGYADIPEVWQGSTFTKSYSFNMTLRSPYADPVSIFQSIYIPLTCLLAAALPRAVGKNAYTSPFLVRAYCKGLFAIPMGIIDSVTIKRGASEFGWSTSMLPTVVEVSFTIKDLAPAMHIAMMSGMETLFNIFSQNSSFQEYLLTLSGLGLNERLIWFRQVSRKFETALGMYRTSIESPLWWSTNIGNSSVARLVGIISPWNRYGSR